MNAFVPGFGTLYDLDIRFELAFAAFAEAEHVCDLTHIGA